MTTDRTPPLWARLVQWQPATAAALALHVRALPADWPQRVFGVGRPAAALDLEPAAVGEQYPDRAPEIAPYDEIASLETCPSCTEAEGICRFHEGYSAGHHERNHVERDAVKIRPYMPLLEFLRWQADVSEALDRGQTPPELLAFVPPAPDPDETDEQRADREETEREHARGEHEHCGVTCESEFTAEKLRNGILWRAAPGSTTMLDELLRRACEEGRREGAAERAELIRQRDQIAMDTMKALAPPADTIGLCGYCGVPRETHHHGYVSTAAALAAAPHRITAEEVALGARIEAAKKQAAAEEQQTKAENPRAVCTCGHTRGEHVYVSGRLLCDVCDPDSTENLVCKEYDEL